MHASPLSEILSGICACGIDLRTRPERTGEFELLLGDVHGNHFGAKFAADLNSNVPQPSDAEDSEALSS